eukprot:m.14922 g.14922  ORF g.14922 m.14922 type:complete len:469 (+) comp10352_c0_seq1:173-1579(+)
MYTSKVRVSARQMSRALPPLTFNGIATTSRWFSSSKLLNDKPVTPDFTTPVNVAEIKLSRPKARARKQSGSWEGLEGLASRVQGSLVESTLENMENDDIFKTTATQLKKLGAEKMSLDERKKRRRALDHLGLASFSEFLEQHNVEQDLTRTGPDILQLNVGIYCNQACNHCHVESSPKRTETMSDEVAERCLALLKASPATHTLDLTGGAPELNAAFRGIVSGARADGFTGEIIDRCNLTVLLEPGQEDLVDFLVEHRVRVVASLPCYSAKNVNQQRGKGVFDRSIAALRLLNAAGYADGESGLHLDLVYNPSGAFLAPDQEALQDQYREELGSMFGVSFDTLFTITNMPIKRFADFLYRRGELEEYMELLVRNFNPAAVGGVMCRNTVSVGWDGNIYDCDFNQQLGMGAGTYVPEAGPTPEAVYNSNGLDVFGISNLNDLMKTEIVVDAHCFGCTAGKGSSCQGATV